MARGGGPGGFDVNALMKQAPDLFTSKPEIHKLDILADKLPH